MINNLILRFWEPNAEAMFYFNFIIGSQNINCTADTETHRTCYPYKICDLDVTPTLKSTKPKMGKKKSKMGGLHRVSVARTITWTYRCKHEN